MKIKSIKYEVYLQNEPFKPFEGRDIDIGRFAEKPYFPVMRITTDTDLEGYDYGAAVAWSYPRVLSEQDVNRARQAVCGEDPLYRELIWQKLWFLRTPVKVISAVDIALWDIAGKYLGQPIYKLLGAYRDKVKVYASSFRLSTIDDYIKYALAAKEHGITAYKIHPYWGEPVKDIELCRCVREAVGDDMVLMHDPYGRYNREEALCVGKELEKLNFYWFEDPIRDYDIEGLIKLREKLSVPICAVEQPPMSMFSIPEYLTRGAVDMVRCDTLSSGGITPLKKIADMCNAFGMQCEVHLGGVANLHVQCAIKNCEFYEMFWPREFRYGLKEYPMLDDRGHIHVPKKPGLGVDIDWESLGAPVATY